MNYSPQLFSQFFITLPALLVSMILHEIAHGYVAFRLGDDTASRQKRLSLNPLRHLDVFGSAMLFLTFFGSGGSMLFGWAKPVPINPGRFKDPQRGMMWVGAAGPVTNFLLAAVSALVLEKWTPSSQLLLTALFMIFQLNVILMLFNLIPVPPLDGSRILGGFLNRRAYMQWIQMDRYGMFFIMILLFLIIGPLQGAFSDVIRSVYRVFLPSFGF